MYKKLRKLGISAVLGFSLCFPLIGSAQETNQETEPTNTQPAQGETSGTVHHYKYPHAAPTPPTPIPPDVLKKLQPDQVMELMRSRRFPDVNDIVTTIAVFSTIVLVVATLAFLRFRRTRMLHETLRLMIEKGATIPPELLNPAPAVRRPQSDLRSGLVLTGIGLGLAIFFAAKGGHAWGLGLIPMFMGIALLITWNVERNKIQPK